jgi:ketosteroid isomerase-like protein
MKPAIWIAILAGATACGDTGDGPAADDVADRPAVDGIRGESTETAERPSPGDAETLMVADRAFAAAVAEGGSAAWASWFHEDGAMIQPRIGEVRGRDEILAFMAGLDDPGTSLRWEPQRAEIAASGDLGWTTGTYVSASVGEDGETVRGEGRYVSIWRRAADGSWRVVMDLGNPTETPPERR